MEEVLGSRQWGGGEKEDKWSQQMLIWYMDSPALLATLQMEHDGV